jgi:hypothetical protein
LQTTTKEAALDLAILQHWFLFTDGFLVDQIVNTARVYNACDQSSIALAANRGLPARKTWNGHEKYLPIPWQPQSPKIIRKAM